MINNDLCPSAGATETMGVTIRWTGILDWTTGIIAHARTDSEYVAVPRLFSSNHGFQG